VGHDDLVDDHLLVVENDRKRRFSLRVDKDGPAAPDIPLGPVGGLHLAVDHTSLPPVPEDLRILVRDFGQFVLTVEEDEDMVVEDCQEVAELVSILLIRIRVTPEL